MTMSLDGFISDKHGGIGELYADFAELPAVASFQEMIEQTGAVVMGRHAFEMGELDDYAESYEFQVPIFVLTHHPPQKHPQESETLKFTFVTDGIESAIMQAKEAAGDKDVQVIGGASTIQQCLDARLCDELHVDIISVLLGEGLRLFEHLDTDRIKLETIRTEETTPIRTSLVLRVVK